MLTTLMEVNVGLRSKGLHIEKVGGWVSARASRDLRLIGWRGNGTLFFVFVGHHDQAYRWANRHKPISEEGKLLAVVPIRHEDDALGETREGRIEFADASLPFSSLPAPVAQLLGSIRDTDQLLDVIQHLAPEWQEQALNAASEALDVVLALEIPSNIVVVDNDRDLEFALRLPAELWRLFLHPRQRFIVDMPVDRHILLRGGPGTGKTVTLVHRFTRLLRRSQAQLDKPPALIAVNRPTREAMLQSLARLDIANAEHLLLAAPDLPRGQSEFVHELQKYCTVIVDEGQDLPVGYIATLLSVLDASRPVPPHMIAFDANQAILSPSGDALTRLTRYCDVLTFGYNYRSTRQISERSLAILSKLHQYRGKDFQQNHDIRASRDTETATYRSGLQGPEITTHVVADRLQLTGLLTQVLMELDRAYGSHRSRAVIVAAGEHLDMYAEIREAVKRLDPEILVLSPVQAKGLEFFAGVVIDALEYGAGQDAEVGITRGRYKQLSGLYVALSRFRDRAVCLCLSEYSPILQHGSPA